MRHITREVLQRLSYISTDLLSMIVRVLHSFPICHNQMFQERILKEIESRTPVGLFQVEAFLIFVNGCYGGGSVALLHQLRD